ncbi:MAG: TIGR03915 family putative DNA repair protein [Lachnospiraceae bacterium]|nr:TIGR03915 family putative DNA repair protein [Lachnospiraceae bacterium]
MTIYTCRQDLTDMMTCIYDAWASRRGHANVRLMCEPVFQQDLFCEYIHVSADEEKARKVLRSIKNKISPAACMQIMYAALSWEEDALDAIYRFLIVGFGNGAATLSMLSHPAVMRLMEIYRNVRNEAHVMIEFSRFTSIGQKVYVSHIEPKSDVLVLTAEHFADRMPSEYFLIIDDNRRNAAVHPPNEAFYIRHLTAEEAACLSGTEQAEDTYAMLWRTFFDAIGIKERENPDCQRNFFPIFRRTHVTEFL